jgi:hypothetical protein
MATGGQMGTLSRPSALIRPTLDTKFHIDYEWWDRTDEDLRIYLLSHLQPEQREIVAQSQESRTVDHIDPETGEVFRMDELELALHLAAQDPEFINPHTSLVDSVFRVFLRNQNTPLSPRELEVETGRPAETIRKTFSGVRIYKGIRPYSED